MTLHEFFRDSYINSSLMKCPGGEKPSNRISYLAKHLGRIYRKWGDSSYDPTFMRQQYREGGCFYQGLDLIKAFVR